MENRIELLVQRMERIASDSTPRRRIDLVQRAVDEGHSIEYGDLIYDLAEEEGIDPPIAFELVLIGVGVRELTPPSEDLWQETQVEAPPPWVNEQEEEAAPLAAQERHMRTTFRRLRAALEEHGSLLPAVEAFVRQPDVAEMKY